jgi:transposase InsO family protein
VGWAYDRAVSDRRPSPRLVHHSDRGSSYTALVFGEILRAYGLRQSVGRPAACYDDAAIESFFATLKNEVIHRHAPYTREDLIRDLVGYLEGFYNRRRLHSATGYRSPAQVEQLVRSSFLDSVPGCAHWGQDARYRGETAPRHAPASLRACPRAMSVSGW